MSPDYESIIGLEIHARLQTNTKAFCGCSTQSAPPNTLTCPVCLGHPGAMPIINKKMVDFAIKLGLACNCCIRTITTFSRKNYFYPDLSKGYQITQYEDPICHDGWIEIETATGTTRRIGIARIHMEEDSGKSIHDQGPFTLIDMNRGGVPLLEIVSEPDMRSAKEACSFFMQIRQILMYLEICSGNMEDGAMRCDINVSVKPRNSGMLGTKTEIKNLNSFRNVEKAIDYEIKRQIGILENGGTIEHETMMWDERMQVVHPMRSKEETADYRYLTEPDLPKIKLNKEWIEEIAADLPEMPLPRKIRFIAEYGLPAYDASILTEDKSLADFFEAAISFLNQKTTKRFKLVSNWVMTDIMNWLAEMGQGRDVSSLNPAHLAELVELIDSGEISGIMARQILPDMLNGNKPPGMLVKENGLTQQSDEDVLKDMISAIISENPDAVEKYRNGKKNILGYLAGLVIRKSGNMANPHLVNLILENLLNES